MFKNLTPHAIKIHTEFGFCTLLPESHPARVSEIITSTRQVDSITFVTKSFGEVIDLPNEEAEVFLVVSAMVRSALPHRKDLLSPGDLIRDTAGAIIGCKNFITN